MFEEKLELFYKRAIETWDNMYSFVHNCEVFQEVWKYKFPSVEKCAAICVEAKEEMENMKVRLMNKNIKCAVIGKASSGKSTLINALLTEKILPNGFCCKTNCFIEVKRSLNSETYIVVGNEKQSIELLNDLADDFSPEALPQGSSIELFYSSDNNSLLTEDFIIMDTPGFDDFLVVDNATSVFDDIAVLDNAIIDKCIDSDVIILVVSSVIGLGEIERKFISRYQTTFSKFNVLLLYSFWDKPQSENMDRSNTMRAKRLLQAKKYLESDLQISPKDIENRIFFISAEEKLLSLENHQNSLDQYTRNRNDEFDQFLNYLQSYVSKSSQNKRLNIVHDIYSILDKVLKEINGCFQEMENTKKKFGEKLCNDLSKLYNFKEKIDAEIENSFKEAYNHFFYKCLNIIKIDDIRKDSEVIEKLNYVLQELLFVSIESLKLRITEIAELTESSEKEHYANILKTLYFPFYFKLETSMLKNKVNIDAILKSFVKINRVKKIGTGLSIAVSVVGASAILASGGIFAGVVLPISTLIGASVLGVVGAAVGGGAGGGISSKLLSISKEAFSSFYKAEEALIKELWKKIEEEIKKSYNEFINQLPSKIGCIMETLKKEYFSLSNKLNFLKSEECRIKNIV